MDERGLTLIELAVVIAIVGILMVLAGFQFVGWQARYKVESQIKEMYADLLEARQRAMQRNRTYFIRSTVASPDQYTTYEDANGNNTLDIGTDTVIPNLSKQDLRYRMAWNFGGTVTMDKRGLIEPSGSVWLLDPDGNPFSEDEVDYDCIVVSRTRINLGKYDVTQNPPCVHK